MSGKSQFVFVEVQSRRHAAPSSPFPEIDSSEKSLAFFAYLRHYLFVGLNSCAPLFIPEISTNLLSAAAVAKRNVLCTRRHEGFIGIGVPLGRPCAWWISENVKDKQQDFVYYFFPHSTAQLGMHSALGKSFADPVSFPPCKWILLDDDDRQLNL